MASRETPVPAVRTDGARRRSRPTASTACTSRSSRTPHLDPLADDTAATARSAPRIFRDAARIISPNDSPDVGFDASINPYRGCEHGCIYCYARPDHEYLGLSAGLDFETQDLREGATRPSCCARSFVRRAGQPQVAAISGVTDCYQPVERQARAHAPLPRGAGGVPQPGRHHHEEPPDHARHRRPCGAGRAIGAAIVVLSVTTLDAEMRSA